MLEQGASVKVIQERLGHSTMSTTMNIYLHRSPNMQEGATKLFDEAFRGLNGAQKPEAEASVGTEE
jgi:integrase